MERPDIENIEIKFDYLKQSDWDALAWLRGLRDYIFYLEAQDRRRDWPTALHEQYLLTLDERDGLQERIDYLEETLSNLDYWDNDTTLKEYNERFGLESG